LYTVGCELAHVVREARAPYRHELFDVRLVDLLQRAVHLEVVAHAEGRDVVGVVRLVEQIVGGLSGRDAAPRAQRRGEYFLHDDSSR
jgi:hypothetical protein